MAHVTTAHRHVAIALLACLAATLATISCTRIDPTIADDANPTDVSASRLTFETARTLIAGGVIAEDAPLVIVLTTGAPLARGSKISIAFPTAVQEEAGDLWSIPTTTAGAPGFCRVDEGSAADIELVSAGRAKGGAGAILVQTVRALETGRSVRIHLTGQIPKIVPKRPFRVIEFDSSNARLARVADENIQLPPVVAGPAVRVLATLPSDAGAGEAFRLRLTALDGFGNVDSAFRGAVTLSGPFTHLPKSVPFTEEHRGIVLLEGLTNTQPGFARILGRAAIATGESAVVSNPMQVWTGTPPMRRFVGDAHFHSGSNVATLSTDGGDHRGQFVSSADAFAYLRDVAGADWGISAEHDTGMTDATWLENQTSVASLEQTGRFVTLLGYEWTPPRRTGHHVVVFEGGPGSGAPLVGASSGRRGGEGASNVTELAAALRAASGPGHRVLLVPHVMQPFPNDDADREGHELPHEIWDGPQGSAAGALVFNDLRRVGEIYSHHNDDFTVNGFRQTREGRGDAVNQPQLFELGRMNSWSYQHAWASGHRVGVIAGSDNHFGTPGLNDYAPTVPHHSGLAVVFAAALTHDAVFGALYDRRCYATTGARILVDVSIDDLKMGEESKRVAGARLPISVVVAGTAAIESIEVMKFDGADFVAVPGKLELSGLMEAKFTASDVLDASTLYYVRVRQADNEWAWTSPIWIDVPAA